MFGKVIDRQELHIEIIDTNKTTIYIIGMCRYPFVLILFLGMTSVFVTQLSAQKVAVKSNALFWLTTSPNVGLELAIGNKMSVEFAATYNPWTFKKDKKMRFWLVQPEMKYWFCEKFEGHFIGLHLHGAQYFGGFGSKSYDGYLAGGGITYGYDWILSSHWNLEAAVGIGYAHLWFDKSPRIYCEKCRTSERLNYWGPTKAAISLVYVF